jgi:ABC-type bacteriocin/lantibiotic exporter with double-glycine peptidase domain
MDWNAFAERMFTGLVIFLAIVFCIAMWKLVLILLVAAPVMYGLGWLYDRIKRGR